MTGLMVTDEKALRSSLSSASGAETSESRSLSLSIGGEE